MIVVAKATRQNGDLPPALKGRAIFSPRSGTKKRLIKLVCLTFCVKPPDRVQLWNRNYYKLLAQTMKKDGKAGVATFLMRGKESLVAIFAENGILHAETMRFSDELRTPADIGLPRKPKVPKATVTKFEKLISSKSKKPLSPLKLEDEQTARLLRLVKKKSGQRKNIIEVEDGRGESELRKVVDLVAILKQSLAGKGWYG